MLNKFIDYQIKIYVQIWCLALHVSKPSKYANRMEKFRQIVSKPWSITFNLQLIRRSVLSDRPLPNPVDIVVERNNSRRTENGCVNKLYARNRSLSSPLKLDRVYSNIIFYFKSHSSMGAPNERIHLYVWNFLFDRFFRSHDFYLLLIYLKRQIVDFNFITWKLSKKTTNNQVDVVCNAFTAWLVNMFVAFFVLFQNTLFCRFGKSLQSFERTFSVP